MLEPISFEMLKILLVAKVTVEDNRQLRKNPRTVDFIGILSNEIFNGNDAMVQN